MLYVPGGNPAPDFAIGAREGENLYSGSVVVLDAKTGDYKQPLQDRAEGLARLGRVQPADPDQDAGRQAAHGGAHRRTATSTAIDLATDDLLYRVPVTTIENAEAPFASGKPVRFCPGSVGGAEWNSPAYDPATNLILIGEVDWCDTVTLEDDQKLAAAPMGQPWTGMATLEPVQSSSAERPIRTDTGPAGSTPSMPTPASGRGG